MARQIIDSSDGSKSGGFRSWCYELGTDRGSRERTEVRVTGTALACHDDTLPPQVAAAKQSLGRTVLEGLLAWSRLPRLVTVTSDWITLHHANGHFSRIGLRLPDEPARRLETLTERARIRFTLGQGVEQFYEHRGDGHWVLLSYQAATLRDEEPRTLADVVAKLSGERLQAALDADPEGASLLTPTQLDGSERQVLWFLVEESIEDTIEDLRIRLTQGREHTYDEVEEILDRLWIRGYVEEFRPGHWEVTPTALHIKKRLLGAELTAA